MGWRAQDGPDRIFSRLGGAVLGIGFGLAVWFRQRSLGLVLMAAGAGLQSSTVSSASRLAVILRRAALQLGYLCGLSARLLANVSPMRSPPATALESDRKLTRPQTSRERSRILRDLVATHALPHVSSKPFLKKRVTACR